MADDVRNTDEDDVSGQDAESQKDLSSDPVTSALWDVERFQKEIRNIVPQTKIDKQLYEGSSDRLADCFNQRANILSSLSSAKARFEPVGDGTKYKMVIRDKPSGLMVVLDYTNPTKPITMQAYEEPKPFSEAEFLRAPSYINDFNEIYEEIPIVSAINMDDESRIRFINHVITVNDLAASIEESEKTPIRDGVSASSRLEKFGSGLESLQKMPGLKTLGGALALVGIVQAGKEFLSGKAAQGAVTLAGSVPLVGDVLGEIAARGAQYMGFDVNDGPLTALNERFLFLQAQNKMRNPNGFCGRPLSDRPLEETIIVEGAGEPISVDLSSLSLNGLSDQTDTSASPSRVKPASLRGPGK